MISNASGAVGPLTAVSQLAENTAKVTPAAAESTKMMMDSVVRVINAADEATGLFGGGDEITKLLDAVNKLTEAAAGGGGGEASKEIKLYMDRNGRKEFAKGIIDDLSPELNKKLSISKGPQISG